MFLILLTIIGINIVPFIFFKLDIWQAQAFWILMMVLAMFCWQLVRVPNEIKIKNIPLALFLGWAGINTAYFCLTGDYDSFIFWQFFNIFCAFFAYKFLLQYVTVSHLENLVKAIRWVVIANLIMCGLQIFGLSQFFEPLSTNTWAMDNMVVGFIGQPTHLAGFLAMFIPVFLYRVSRETILCLILMGLILCFYTGTTKGDISIGGVMTAVLSLLYFSYHKGIKYFTKVIAFLLLIGISVFFVSSDF